MENKKDENLFSWLFFREEKLPGVFDYSDFLNSYSNFLTLFLSDDSSFYHDIQFLNIVVEGFKFCYDFYFGQCEDCDYNLFADQVVCCIEEWKLTSMDSLSLAAKSVILSYSSAFTMSEIDDIESNRDVVQTLVDNTYRILLIENEYNNSFERGM